MDKQGYKQYKSSLESCRYKYQNKTIIFTFLKYVHMSCSDIAGVQKRADLLLLFGCDRWTTRTTICRELLLTGHQVEALQAVTSQTPHKVEALYLLHQEQYWMVVESATLRLAVESSPDLR